MSDAVAVLAELARIAASDDIKTINEAATRLRLIDRILIEVLGWSREGMRPEDAAKGEDGQAEWLDYHLDTGVGPKLIVEAKRVSREFQFAGERRPRMYRLKTLRSSHGGELGSVIKQAMQYSQSTGTYSFVVTNGVQWIASIAFWPNTSPDSHLAVVFYDLDDVRTNLPLFAKLLSPDGVARDNLLLEALGGASALRPSFASSVNSTSRHNPPQDRNYLSAPIEVLMRAYFSDLKLDARDLLQRCYVANELTEGYVARLETFVGNTMPYHGFSSAIKVDRSKFEREPSRDRFTTALADGAVLYLVGRVGSGKTSFALYAINQLRERLGDDLVIVHLDLINTTQLHSKIFDHDILRDELSKAVLREAESAYPHLNPYLHDNLMGIFSSEVQRELGAMHPSMRESEAGEVRLDALLHSLREDPFLHACSYLHYVVANRGRPAALILDNIDRGTEEFERFCVTFARRLSAESSATCVVAMRDTTYHAGIRGGFLDVSQAVVFTISPPPFLSVVSRRTEYARSRWTQDPELLRRVERHLDPYPRRAVEDFIDVLSELLLGGKGRDFTEAIQALAGTNVRLGLDLLRQFATSRNTDIERLLREYNQEFFGQDLGILLRSLMRGDLARYEEAGKQIVNLFQVSTDTTASHFTSVRLLQFLTSVADNPRADTDVNAAEAIALVSAAAGHFAKNVSSSLNHLGRFGLVISRSSPEPPWDDDSVVRISASGRFYLRTLLRNREYIENVTDDTVIYDQGIHQSMCHIHRTANVPWPERARKKTELFLNYLWSREREEIARGRPSGDHWLIPVSVEIANAIFGGSFASDLMRKR